MAHADASPLKFSPKWVCVRLDSIGARLISAVQELKRKPAAFAVVVVLFLLATTFCSIQLRDLVAADLGLGALRRIFDRTMLIAVSLMALLTFFPALRAASRRSSVRVLISFVVAWLFVATVDDRQPHLVSFTLYMLIPVFLGWIHLKAPSRDSYRVRLSLYLLSCAGAFLSLELFAGGLGALGIDVSPLPPMPILHVTVFSSVFLMHQIAQLKPTISFVDQASHILSPIHLISGFPTPVATLPEAQTSPTVDDSSVRGFASFALGTSAVFLAALISVWRRESASPDEFWLLRGWWTYQVYLLFWLGLTRIGYGLGLQLGYDLRAPTRYVFFAADPLDRWKRWNLYFYEWFLTYVFVPVARRARYPLAGIVAVFALNFVLHNWISTTAFLFRPEDVDQRLIDILGNEAKFYALQGLTVYSGFRFRALWPSETTLAGWWGVIITHILMAGTHSVINL